MKNVKTAKSGRRRYTKIDRLPRLSDLVVISPAQKTSENKEISESTSDADQKNNIKTKSVFHSFIRILKNILKFCD